MRYRSTMASSFSSDEPNVLTLLYQLQATLQTIQEDYKALSAVVGTIDARVDTLSRIKEIHATAGQNNYHNRLSESAPRLAQASSEEICTTLESTNPSNILDSPKEASTTGAISRSNPTSRIVLTTYPGQSGIDPLKMHWGNVDPMHRGPVVVSRNHSTIRRRNGKLSHISPCGKD